MVFQGLAGGPGSHDGEKASARPVESKVRNVALTARADGGASVSRRDTSRFSLLGVTWTDPAVRVDGRIEARTRSVTSGRWTGWQSLGADGDSRSEAGRTGVRGSTDPVWVGPSNGVEVRVVAVSGTTGKLPAGLRLDMVDPGGPAGSDAAPAAFTVDDGPEDTGDPTDSPTPADPPVTTSPPTEPPVTTSPPTPTVTTPTAPTTKPTPTTPTTKPTPSASTPTPTPTTTVPPAPPSTMPKPTIVSRAAWGADESISPEEPGYLAGGVVKAVFVHHSAGTNNYSCADSASLVRGIYAYHVKSNGWKDIGYNFLVDKCGTIFEGRKGGVDRPVMGAHTYGWNAESTGISVLGDYTSTPAPNAVLASVARIAAWKLGQYGGNPAATVPLVSGATQTNYFGTKYVAGTKYTFQQVSGHRDGFNTQCPGSSLYAQLPTIRTWAAGPVTGLAVKSVAGGATLSGSAYYTKAAATVTWAATTPAALISKYELLVDGKAVATTPGTGTSAQANLAVGTHAVQVRATHRSGKTATSAAVTVVAETTRPTFTTKPSVALRKGTVSTTSVPVTLSWKAADSAVLKSVSLTAPVKAVYGPTVTSASLTAKPGAATTFALTAADVAGNTAAASVAATPVILQETAAAKSGTWAVKSSTQYLGGKSYTSKTKNAALTWTFTGRSVSWLVSRASNSGQAVIYVDGVKTATVDLKSATTSYRQAIWTKSWTGSAKHKVKVVVVGTSGRPDITTDGLVYLK